MVTFKELGRVQASRATEIVVSQVIEDGEMKGLNINSYVTTAKYTGYTKGIFVPVGAIEEFGELVKTALAQ